MTPMLAFPRLLAMANALFLTLAARAEDVRPNVVVLVANPGLSADSATAARLAREGTVFPEFLAPGSRTAARASWLTGVHEFRAGVSNERGGRNLLSPKSAVMAEAFRTAGYRTALMGGWGLGENLPCRPEDRGFDDLLVHGADGPGSLSDRWGNPAGPDVADGWMRKREGWVQLKGSYSAALAEEAKRWLGERKTAGKPFFLQLELSDRDEGALKSGAGNDAAFAAVLAELDRLELAANTLVVCCENGSGGLVSKGRLTFRWPAHVAAGKSVAAPAGPPDGWPTLAALTKVPVFRDWTCSGIDLSPALLGEGTLPQDRPFFFHLGGWSGDDSPERNKSRDFAVREGKWQLEGLQLFNIDDPLDKRTDSFERNAKLGSQMLKTYGRWWDDVRPGLAEPVRQIVGDERQKVVALDASGWWPSREVEKSQGAAECRDQRSVRGLLEDLADPQRSAGLGDISGHWKLQAARDGHYNVTLWKLPKDASAEERSRLGTLRKGTVHARAGKFEVRTEMMEKATSVTVGLDFKQGPVELEAWFGEQTGKGRLLGAFFVTVERVGDRKMPDPDWKVGTEGKK